MVLMVRLFWVFFFLGFGLAVSAQDDPVLMRINGKEVLRSEFERSYNKGGTSVGAGRKALDAYVNKFIDFRLKIEAAEVVGLDTSRVFQKEQDEYRSAYHNGQNSERDVCLLRVEHLAAVCDDLKQ